jgi:hypothetical protein
MLSLFWFYNYTLIIVESSIISHDFISVFRGVEVMARHFLGLIFLLGMPARNALGVF